MTDLPPVRCFTCGRVIAAKLDRYWALLRADPQLTERQACDRVGLPADRYCCRGLFLCTAPPAPLDDPANTSLAGFSPMVVFQSEALRSAGPSGGGTARAGSAAGAGPGANTANDPSGAGAGGKAVRRHIPCI